MFHQFLMPLVSAKVAVYLNVYVRWQIKVPLLLKLTKILHFQVGTQTFRQFALTRRPCRWEAEENKRGCGSTAGPQI